MTRPSLARRPLAYAATTALVASAVALQAAPPSASAAPKHGGTLVYALSSALPQTFDPDLNYVKSEIDGPDMEAIYGLLAYQNPKTGAVVPVFLKSMKPSNGNRTWTLVLHSGIKFSDGTPFDAAAIAFNIARGAGPNSDDLYRTDLAQMHTKVVNATTLQITEATPNVAIPSIVAQEIPFIASPTAVKKEGANYDVHPVGAGPFTLGTVVQNSSLTLEKNPTYSSFAPGEPYLDSIQLVQLTASQTQELNAMSAGTAQMTWVQGNTQIKQARSEGSKVVTTSVGGGEWLDFNTTTAPFNNLKARQAVFDALDHQQLADSWTPGIPAMTNLMPKTSPFYSAKYDFPAPNPAKAKQLFGQLAAAGKPVQFACTLIVPFNSVCPYVQSTLQGYPGVKVTVNMVNSATYNEDQANSNFQMISAGGAYVNPIPVLLNSLAGVQNYGKWNDPIVTAAKKKLLSTSNMAAQKKLWGTIQAEYLKGLPFFTSQSNLLAIVYNDQKVGGVSTIEFGTIPRTELLYDK